MTPNVSPQHSPRLFGLFGAYLRRYFRRHFDAVRVARNGVPQLGDRPTVIYANHPSWWDPILFMLLAHELYPERTHFGPMDAAALKKYRFFARLGVFPVEQGTVLGAKQFHRAGRDVLSRAGATLWVTPQGRFVDARDRDVSFAAGLAGLVAADLDCQVVPMAIEYPFWAERLPEVLVRFGDPVVASDLPRARRERSEFLRARLADAQSELAASARRRDSAEFHSLLAGRAGVGGVYDGWRRAIAALRGERFVAAHMPAERADDESARGVA